jgi:hypothetical protein
MKARGILATLALALAAANLVLAPGGSHAAGVLDPGPQVAQVSGIRSKARA